MKRIILIIVVVVLAGAGIWYAFGGHSNNPAQVSPGPSVSASQTPSSAGRCIITIDGQKYDVTDFRNVHQGGDIFVCGTDMSMAFHAQHGDGTGQLQQIQNLKVN